MKSIITAITALAATILFADGELKTGSERDVEAETAQVKAVMVNALQRLDQVTLDAEEDNAVVQAVYGEGTNSSFIVRKELTATQKRFIALGRQFMRLALYAQTLERRLAVLEDEREQRLTRISVAKEKREGAKRKRDEKLRRAAEKASNASRKGAK